MTLEQRLHAALEEAAVFEPSPDLLDRVEVAIGLDAGYRRRRNGLLAGLAVAVLSLAGGLLLLSDFDQGRVLLQWWELEMVVSVAMAGLVVGLGSTIRRFGTVYASGVFATNRRAGSSFIVLMDFAYYLVFGAIVLITISFEPQPDWSSLAGAAQLEHEIGRIAGLLVGMGMLHGLNVLALPLIGGLLASDEEADSPSR